MPDKDEKDKTATPQGEDTEPAEKSIPYPRFKEVIDQANTLKAENAALKEAEKKRQEEAAKAAGNWQKLAEDAKREADEAKKELAAQSRYNKFLSIAASTGIVDAELAYKALPDTIEGENMEELVQKLAESRPFLFGVTKNEVPNIESGGTKKPPRKQTKSFTQWLREEANK